MEPKEDASTLTRSSSHVQIEHVRVWTAKPFAEVIRDLEAETGLFDSGAIQASVEAKTPPGSTMEAIAAMAGRSGFMRFAALDHGSILRLQGKPAKAIRYLIGHPLTAVKMTKLRIGSALYVPLSLLVAADERGGAGLEYDRPSTLLGQFEDPGVAAVARELDDQFAALILSISRIR